MEQTCGRGLAPMEDELGIHVCGGRGRHSRRTPDELTALGDRIGLDAPALVRSSRLVAKVDSAAVQDGFDLYLHGFFVTDDGKWTVVQQGMSDARRQARRYHWHSENFTSFVDLFDPEEGRMGVAVTFIAILELLKEALVEVVQSDEYAPLHVRAASSVRLVEDSENAS